MAPGPGEHISITSSGSITGASIGGSHNTVITGPVTNTTNQLAADLETVLAVARARTPDGQPGADVAAVEHALEHARGGRLEQAKGALRKDAGSVLEMARGAGTTVLTRELEQLLS